MVRKFLRHSVIIPASRDERIEIRKYFKIENKREKIEKGDE